MAGGYSKQASSQRSYKTIESGTRRTEEAVIGGKQRLCGLGVNECQRCEYLKRLCRCCGHRENHSILDVRI